MNPVTSSPFGEDAHRHLRTSYSFALLRPHIFACRIGPAHLGRENDLDIAAGPRGACCAKLERFQPAAWHRELRDGLRALIPLAGDARGKPIVGSVPDGASSRTFSGRTANLDRFTGLYVGRHQRREANPPASMMPNSPLRSMTRP